MADTINVPVLKSDGWKAVIAGPAQGVVSIAGNGQHCIYTGTPPAELIGHRFTGDLVQFSLVTGESLNVKVGGDTTVIITEG